MLFEVGLPRGAQGRGNWGHGLTKRQGVTASRLQTAAAHLPHAAGAGCVQHIRALGLSRAAHQDGLTSMSPQSCKPSLARLSNPTQWNEGRTRGVGVRIMQLKGWQNAGCSSYTWPRLGRETGEAKGLSKLWEIVKDREVWHAAVHAVTESRARLSD